MPGNRSAEPDDPTERAWLPEAAEAADAVMILHGAESHAGWFEEFGALLAERGLAVYAADRPGWGRAGGTRGHLASYADALAFVERQANRLREKHERVHLVGQSWGGLLALYASMRRACLFDSVVLLSPNLRSRKDFCGGLRPSAAMSALMGRRKRIYPFAFGAEDFTGAAKWRTFIDEDPLAVRCISAGFGLETVKMRSFILQQAGFRTLPPTLALFASDDAITHTPASQAIAERAGATTRVYADTRHALIFEAPGRVVDDIVEWIDRARRGEPPPPDEDDEDRSEGGGKDKAEDKAENGAKDACALVMGAGAAGQTLGALLALSGRPTLLVARPAQVEAIRACGVELRLGDGMRRVGREQGLSAVERVGDAMAAAGTFPGLVVLAVKSYDTEAALRELHPVVGPRTVLASLQNGCANEDRIALAFPANPVLAAALCAYLDLDAPGRVVWAGDRGGLAGAAWRDPDPDNQCEAAWRRYFEPLRMDTRWIDRPSPPPAAAYRVKWSKLSLNVAFNAINASTGLSTPEILAHPEYGMMAVLALRETFRTMRRCGARPVNLPGYPVAWLARLARWLPLGLLRRLLARQAARDPAGASSMRQDKLRGRAQTEIDDLNGAVVRAAAELGLRAPANEAIAARFR